MQLIKNEKGQEKSQRCRELCALGPGAALWGPQFSFLEEGFGEVISKGTLASRRPGGAVTELFLHHKRGGFLCTYLSIPYKAEGEENLGWMLDPVYSGHWTRPTRGVGPSLLGHWTQSTWLGTAFECKVEHLWLRSSGLMGKLYYGWGEGLTKTRLYYSSGVDY